MGPYPAERAGVRAIPGADWPRPIYYTTAFPSWVAIIVKLIAQNPKQTELRQTTTYYPTNSVITPKFHFYFRN